MPLRLAVAVLALLLPGNLAVAPPPAWPVSAQTADGATLTVLRGQVALLRPDGSANQPALSGSVVVPGDEIRTLGNTGALITFFSGTEIELGADTVLVVDAVSRQGDRIEVSLKQVFGTTISRVQTLTDPGSSYRIDAGGTVAIVPELADRRPCLSD